MVPIWNTFSYGRRDYEPVVDGFIVNKENGKLEVPTLLFFNYIHAFKMYIND